MCLHASGMGDAMVCHGMAAWILWDFWIWVLDLGHVANFLRLCINMANIDHYWPFEQKFKKIKKIKIQKFWGGLPIDSTVVSQPVTEPLCPAFVLITLNHELW